MGQLDLDKDESIDGKVFTLDGSIKFIREVKPISKHQVRNLCGLDPNSMIVSLRELGIDVED